jgi:hypothetical protein
MDEDCTRGTVGRTPARERRWLLLAEEGSHSWLGRYSDPDEDDIGLAEASLRRAGLGGWIAVSEGDYWSSSPMTVLQVRTLAVPKATFADAVKAFLLRRQGAVEAVS